MDEEQGNYIFRGEASLQRRVIFGVRDSRGRGKGGLAGILGTD